MFGPRADSGWYRMTPPPPKRKVWVRESDGRAGCFEVPEHSIDRAIRTVRRQGYRTVLVEVK